MYWYIFLLLFPSAFLFSSLFLIPYTYLLLTLFFPFFLFPSVSFPLFLSLHSIYCISFPIPVIFLFVHFSPLHSLSFFQSPSSSPVSPLHFFVSLSSSFSTPFTFLPSLSSPSLLHVFPIPLPFHSPLFPLPI